MRCVDPIVSTGAVLGRCLTPSHCHNLPGTSCSPDLELTGSPGFQDYFTCQVGRSAEDASYQRSALIEGALR